MHAKQRIENIALSRKPLSHKAFLDICGCIVLAGSCMDATSTRGLLGLGVPRFAGVFRPATRAYASSVQRRASGVRAPSVALPASSARGRRAISKRLQSVERSFLFVQRFTPHPTTSEAIIRLAQSRAAKAP